MKNKCLGIILAAGEGSRMRSEKAKVLHEVGNLSMVCHVAKALLDSGCDHIAVVVGRESERVEKEVSEFLDSLDGAESEIGLSFVNQAELLGTGHAVFQCSEIIGRGFSEILVCFGDTPLINPEDLKKAKMQLGDSYDAVVLGFMAENPYGYGRLLMQDNKLRCIIEEKDANDEQRAVRLCNGGIMVFKAGSLLKYLPQLDNNNEQKEYYLTSLIAKIVADAGEVAVLQVGESSLMGVNTMQQLSEAERAWQKIFREKLLLKGVQMRKPETITFSYDTVIEPGAYLEGDIYFGKNVTVKKAAKIFAFSYIEGAYIEEEAKIGPFARLRPTSIIGKSARIGNFCEIKQANIDIGAKISHLSYIGDAEIGKAVNIGAGTITCNYDGIAKYKTKVKDGAFVGSNSSLVAPITIEEGAYIASSSAVTEDVPQYSLAIARARQINKSDYMKRNRE